MGDKIHGASEDCYIESIESGWSPQLRERLLLDRQARHASGMAVAWQGERSSWSSELPAELRRFLEIDGCAEAGEV